MAASRLRRRGSLGLLARGYLARKDIGAAEQKDMLKMLLPPSKRQQALEARGRHPASERRREDIRIFKYKDVLGFLRHEVVIISLGASDGRALPNDADLPVLLGKTSSQRLREDVWHVHEQELAPLLLPFLPFCLFLSFLHDFPAPFLRPKLSFSPTILSSILSSFF